MWSHHYPQNEITPLSKAMRGRVNAADSLEDAARLNPNATHIWYRNEIWSYAETYELSCCLADGFLKLGLKKGDRVGLCLQNGPAYIVSVFALWRVGLVAVGLNPIQPEKALLQIASDAGIAAIVASDSAPVIEKAKSLVAGMENAPMIVTRDDASDLRLPEQYDEADQKLHSDEKWYQLSDLIRNGPGSRYPQCGSNDLAVLSYTGGTTGEPKGVMLTHANFIAAARQMRVFYGNLKDGEERFLAAAPFTHMGGLQNTLNLPTAIAAEITIVERFDAKATMRLVEERKLTFLLTVPTMLVALMRETEFESTEWGSVRTVVAGGAPLPYQVRSEFETVVGATVRNGYGMTESTGVGAIMPAAPSSSATATGVPLPEVLVEIRDPSGSGDTQLVGAAGEILMSGPHIMAGYWKRPDATKDVFDGDWLKSGDIGYFDEDGFLHVIDRIKDLIIAGGFNIYPAKVEAEIAAHPSVSDVLVIGAPDEYRGETVKAIITLKAEKELSLDSLKAFLKDKLSPIEAPKEIVIVEALPQTAAGKVSRAEARKRFA